MESGSVTGLIRLAVHVDGILTVVMGTTTIAGVDFVVEGEMVGIVKLLVWEPEREGRPMRLS
jgi:hypothetical protein